MSQLAIVNEYDTNEAGDVAADADTARKLINLTQIITAEHLMHDSGVVTTQVEMTDGTVLQIKETIEQLTLLSR